MTSLRALATSTAAALVLSAGIGAASAQDKLKLAAGQRGNWDSAIPELAQRMGIAKKHNLDLEILWNQGGGETQQAVLSGASTSPSPPA